MPYCSKCGVEVDNDVIKCPLCQFKIPEIDGLISEPSKFPIAINEYPQQLVDLKIKIFKSIAIFLSSTVIILLLLNRKISGEITWSKYTSLIFLAMIIYAFFCFGFIKSFRKSFTGVTITTIVLLFLIDIIKDGLTWFVPVGLPITLAIFFIVMIIVYISKRSRSRGLNVIAYSLLGVSILCLIIEFCLTNYVYGFVDLSWSTIVCVQLFALAVILLYIHYRFPEKYKNRIKRFFHV